MKNDAFGQKLLCDSFARFNIAYDFLFVDRCHVIQHSTLYTYRSITKLSPQLELFRNHTQDTTLNVKKEMRMPGSLLWFLATLTFTESVSRGKEKSRSSFESIRTSCALCILCTVHTASPCESIRTSCALCILCTVHTASPKSLNLLNLNLRHNTNCKTLLIF